MLRGPAGGAVAGGLEGPGGESDLAPADGAVLVPVPHRALHAAPDHLAELEKPHLPHGADVGGGQDNLLVADEKLGLRAGVDPGAASEPARKDGPVVAHLRLPDSVDPPFALPHCLVAPHHGRGHPNLAIAPIAVRKGHHIPRVRGSLTKVKVLTIRKVELSHLFPNANLTNKDVDYEILF